MYYFLKKDFEALGAEIEKIANKIRELGKEIGKSCQEGAETFHDNFAYEDSDRQMYMWSGRIRELVRIKNQSRVAEPQKTQIVSFGRTVTIEDEGTGARRVITIGSYMVLAEYENEAISYGSPLARILIGGKVNEVREGVIASRKKSFRILRIE